METLTLLDMRREFGCDRILARFLEQDLKFESFGNLGLIYTLLRTHVLFIMLKLRDNFEMHSILILYDV